MKVTPRSLAVLSLVALMAVLSACMHAPAAPVPTVVPTQEPAKMPFVGEVPVTYEYSKDIPAEWLVGLPITLTQRATEYGNNGYTSLDPQGTFNVGNVEFFMLKVTKWDTTFKDKNETPCAVGHTDGGLYIEKCAHEYDGLNAKGFVSMAFCKPLDNGVACNRDGMSITTDGKTLSFTATSPFLPEYRAWLQHLLTFYKSDLELPDELIPGYNYKFDL